VFIEGRGLDEIFWTPAGALWVTAVVQVVGGHLHLSEFVIYPTTGAHLDVGASSMFGVLRMLLDIARDEGFERCSVAAYRKRPGKPGRIIEREWRFR
jgi:hypothetical protein